MRRISSVLVLLAALAATLAAAPAAHAWIWPVEGAVLRPFSLGPDAYAAGQHRGVDIGAVVETPVLAPAAGTVSFVGSIPGGGRAVTIQTPDGYAVTLLQLGSTSVVRGSAVAEGAVVGVVGESADAVTSAPHVHLGVRVASDPDGYLDPLEVLPPRGPEPVPAPPALVPEQVVVPAPPVVASEPPVVVAEVSPAPTAAAAEASVSVAAATEPRAVIPKAVPQPQPVTVTPDSATPIHGEPQPAEVRAPVPDEIAAVQKVAVAHMSAPALAEVQAAGANARVPDAQPRPARDRAAAPKSTDTAEAPVAAPAPELRAAADRPTGVPRVSLQPNRDVEGAPDTLAPEPGDRRAAAEESRQLPPGLVLTCLAALAGVAGLACRRRREPRDPARIMGGDDRSLTSENPGSGRMALCERTTTHRPRGGLRRPLGHLRPVPPAAGQRRADGQRHRRARHAGHGGRGRGRSLAA
jgi:hypothetical protein